VAAFEKLLVDIPEDKGVHMKSAGAKGEKYVYKYVRYFRNADGQPRNKAKAIGKFDPASGKMFPNHNYFEMYHVDPTLADVSVWDYGYSYLVLKVYRDTGLIECLSQIFGSNAMDIVVMATYMIREGNAMDGLDDWQQRNFFPGFNRLLTSQSTSRLFASFSARKRGDFFKLWVKVALGNKSVFYDVTSISSYAQAMPAVERGYNRDGDDLSQYNLGMFCDESSKIPLYYNRYNGSLTDKTNLSYVLANAKAVGIERVKMILDAGFWSEECFKSLHVHCDAFTIGMPLFLKESERILLTHGQDIEKYANELSRHHHIYCVSVDAEIHGIPGRVLIYYDSYNHLNQCTEMSETIERLGAELAALKRYPKNKLSRYAPYFIVTRHEQDNGFDYRVDSEKIEIMRKAKGYFLIFSTDMQASPADILEHYRAKDADEKLFAQIKVEMDGSRIRTHNEATTDGKTFVTFIACVIRAYMLNKLAKYLTENSTSMKKVFSQLSNITILSNNEGYRFAKALTKKQKQILSAFNAVDDIVSTLKF
jgi:transposase